MIFSGNTSKDFWAAVRESPQSDLLYKYGCMAQEIEYALAKYRWVPVKERLPEKTDEDLRPKILIYNADGIAVQEWRHYAFGWRFDDFTGPPTHWMEAMSTPENL